MAELRNEKYVNSLPSILVANTIYYVKNGAGFDVYITNNSGTIIAYPLNLTTQSWNTLDINVPFPAKYIFTKNVIDANVNTSSTIDVIFASTTDFDENDQELFELGFKVTPNIGSFDLTIFSKDQNKFGGLIKLKYKL